MASIVRLVLDYGPEYAAVVSSELAEGEPPAADPEPHPGADGVWLSVADADGRPGFHYVLPQPERPREMFNADGSIEIVPGSTRTTSVYVELPWLGPDGSFTVVSGRAGAERTMEATEAVEAAAARPLLRMSLGELEAAAPAVEEMALEGVAPPVTPLPFGQDHARAIKLVFLPDGFTAAELPLFHAVVDDFLKVLGQTPPFKDLVTAFSACRVELASARSGIKDPLAPGNGAQPPFGSKLGKGTMRRLIEADQGKAKSAAKQAAGGHKPFAGIVVANTSEYGGSGGDVAVFSREANAAQIAIHELGHSLFSLADEYASAGQSSTDQPIEANVAAKPDPQAPAWAAGEGQRLKWAAQLTAGVALPTPAGSGAATVGAYEGAKYKPHGLFRPSEKCKMRDLPDPFCAVCVKQIRARLQPHVA